MSFGFSIGDVVLCTQIACRLFSALTEGRKDAPRDLRELEDVLFGLHCSLGHLHDTAETILAKAARQSLEQEKSMNQILGSMIHSCLCTLRELENATAKYREAAHDPPPILPSHYAIAGIGLTQRVRSQAKVQWRRFLWDFKGDSLREYRQKLQLHVDNINMLLSTWTLATTHRIEESGQRQELNMEALLHRASRTDGLLLQLVQIALGSMTVTQNTPTFPDPTSSSMLPSISCLAIPDTNETSGSSRSRDISEEVDKSSASSPESWPSTSLSHMRKRRSREAPVLPKSQSHGVPKTIEVINESRQMIGRKEFGAYRQNKPLLPMFPQGTLPHQNTSKANTQTIQQLRRDLKDIFKSFRSDSDTCTKNARPRKITSWVAELNKLPDQTQPSFILLSKQEKSLLLDELVDLLATLNMLIGSAEVTDKRLFYRASQPGLSQNLSFLAGLSVRCQKEIEEFKDEYDADILETWGDRGVKKKEIKLRSDYFR